MNILEAHKASDFIDYKTVGPTHASSFINSLVIPRPIAFITSVGKSGVVNAAPFSYFNVASTNPVILSIAIEKNQGKRKDTSRNILEKGEFVINLCSIEISKAVSLAGGNYPPDISEVELAKLELIPSLLISVPRIANTLAQLECKLVKALEIGNDPTDFIFGELVKAHVHKSLVDEKNRIDSVKLNPLARLSGNTYASLGSFFDVYRS